MQKNSIFLCIYIEILYFIVIIIEEMNITQQSGGHKVAKVSFDNRIMFTYEAKSFPGVNKVAELVREDICLVTGFRAGEYVRGTRCKNLIIFGTVDKSDYLKELDKSGLIRLNDIRGKWETYSFQIVDDPYPDVDHALVIAGSDKRGTIYGLFHLSELLGVSPFVNWNHCYPRRRKNVVLTDECNMVSKEPSVRYRGFFRVELEFYSKKENISAKYSEPVSKISLFRKPGSLIGIIRYSVYKIHYKPYQQKSCEKPSYLLS